MVRELIALSDSSKVWIYPASRSLSYSEIDTIRLKLFPFLDQWTSHSKDLFTYGNIFHRQFLAFFVDEQNYAAASGCSIDSSVRFVKELSDFLKVDFFDRMLFSYLEDSKVKTVTKEQFYLRYKSGIINRETYVFDHLVKTKDDFLNNWIKPLESTWLYRMV